MLFPRCRKKRVLQQACLHARPGWTIPPAGPRSIENRSTGSPSRCHPRTSRGGYAPPWRPTRSAPAASRLARRLTLLAQLSRAAAVGEGEESLYDRVLSLLLPELAPDTAVVFVKVRGEEKLRPRRFHRSSRMAADAPIKISSTVVSRVLADRVPFLASDAGATLATSNSIRAQRIRSDREPAWGCRSASRSWSATGAASRSRASRARAPA